MIKSYDEIRKIIKENKLHASMYHTIFRGTDDQCVYQEKFNDGTDTEINFYSGTLALDIQHGTNIKELFSTESISAIIVHMRLDDLTHTNKYGTSHSASFSIIPYYYQKPLVHDTAPSCILECTGVSLNYNPSTDSTECSVRNGYYFMFEETGAKELRDGINSDVLMYKTPNIQNNKEDEYIFQLQTAFPKGITLVEKLSIVLEEQVNRFLK